MQSFLMYRPQSMAYIAFDVPGWPFYLFIIFRHWGHQGARNITIYLRSFYFFLKVIKSSRKNERKGECLLEFLFECFWYTAFRENGTFTMVNFYGTFWWVQFSGPLWSQSPSVFTTFASIRPWISSRRMSLERQSFPKSPFVKTRCTAGFWSSQSTILCSKIWVYYTTVWRWIGNRPSI